MPPITLKRWSSLLTPAPAAVRRHEGRFRVMKSSVWSRPNAGPGRIGSAFSALAVVALLAGCGGAGGDKQPSQVAAKVNKEELSVHQVNFQLQRARGLRPEQTPAASRQVLERLIDQELAVQRAEELKLDRDPAVLQQLDAARREIVSRAYGDRVAEAAAKPTEADISAYYERMPALFKERRVYSLQELQIDAPADQIDGLRARLGAAKNIGEFVDHLRASGLSFRTSNAVRAAEQLPLGSLDAFAKLKPGEAMFNAATGGAQVVVVLDARVQPVDEAKARPAIEQFLLTERKRKLIDEDIKKLRDAAKIEYVGMFAASAASAAAAAEVAAAAAASATAAAASALPVPSASRPEPVAPIVVKRPEPMPERPLPAASALDADAINSGMGLKR